MRLKHQRQIMSFAPVATVAMNTNGTRTRRTRTHCEVVLRLARSIAAAGLLAVCGALLAPPAADAATTGSISGNVTSAATKGALARVQVCAIQKVSEHEFRTAVCKETNSEGTYAILVEAGTYIVQFSPAFECEIGGCKQANYITQYWNGKSGFESAESVKVEAGKTVTGINAEMQVGGQIIGTVTGAATHGALEHIRVCAFVPQGAFSFLGHCAETNSEGKYTISGLPTAKDVVEFAPGFVCKVSECRRMNYIPQYWNGKSSFESADSVSVEAGKTVEGINAEMHVGGQITGKVTSGGTAVERAFVCAFSSTSGRRECELTNSKGEYTIVGLATGKYNVEFTGVTCPPQGGLCTATYLKQFYSGKATLESAESVSVEAPNTIEGINAEMVPTAATKPVNTGAPVLSGTPGVGQTLHCSQGTWENPATYAYKWLRDGNEIAGQTASAYMVQAADEGHEISCEVIATNGAGSASKASNGVKVESTKPAPGGGGTGGGSTTGGGGTSSGVGSSASGGGSNGGSGGVQSGTLAAHAAKPLTQAQKLANAIAACRKLKKSKRAKCIAAAKKRYSTSKHKAHKKA